MNLLKKITNAAKRVVQGIMGKAPTLDAVVKVEKTLPEAPKPTATPMAVTPGAKKYEPPVKARTRKQTRKSGFRTTTEGASERRRGVFNAMGNSLSRWDIELLAMQARAFGRNMTLKKGHLIERLTSRDANGRHEELHAAAWLAVGAKLANRKADQMVGYLFVQA